MTSNGKCSRTFVLAALLVVASVNGGCTLDQITGILPASVPNVKGTWVGRLERVKVSNLEGEEFDAAELHIEKGPAAKGYYPREAEGYPGEGRVPVLAGWESNGPGVGYIILDPDTLPIGQRVKVSGVLFIYPLFRNPGGAVSRRMHLGYVKGGQEQILYVRGIAPLRE